MKKRLSGRLEMPMHPKNGKQICDDFDIVEFRSEKMARKSKNEPDWLHTATILRADGQNVVAKTISPHGEVFGDDIPSMNYRNDLRIKIQASVTYGWKNVTDEWI